MALAILVIAALNLLALLVLLVRVNQLASMVGMLLAMRLPELVLRRQEGEKEG